MIVNSIKTKKIKNITMDTTEALARCRTEGPVQKMSEHPVFDTMKKVARGRIDLFPRLGFELGEYLNRSEDVNNPSEYGKQLGERALLLLSVLMSDSNILMDDLGEDESLNEEGALRMEKNTDQEPQPMIPPIWHVAAGYFATVSYVWPFALCFILFVSSPFNLAGWFQRLMLATIPKVMFHLNKSGKKKDNKQKKQL